MTCARGLGKETRSAVAATMAACRVPLICARSSSPVRDPVEGNQVVLPHLDQQPAGGLLVFGFSLVDDTLADELVVDLPDGHWVVVVLRVIDCGANRVDLGHLATTFPVYRSRPIKGLHDALRSTSVILATPSGPSTRVKTLFLRFTALSRLSTLAPSSSESETRVFGWLATACFI